MNFRMGQVGWLTLALAGTGVALFGAEGCTITTGNGDLDGSVIPDASNDADANVIVPNSCNGCLFDQCSGQWASCQNDAECAAIYACSTRPSCASDGACVQACYDAHPTGQKVYLGLAKCDGAGICTTCSATCSAIRDEERCAATDDASVPDATTDAATDSGTTADAGTVPPAELACSVCTQQLCGPEKAACSPNTECDQYQQCVTFCSGRPDADIPGCLDDCALLSDGKAAADALGQCNTDKCGVICGYRSN